MKTITLTDDAYERLLSWKRGPKDSFSSVVLSVVPKKGTLGQMVQDIQALPPLAPKHAKVMEEAAEWGRSVDDAAKKWTS